jgi:hypothetical protein
MRITESAANAVVQVMIRKGLNPKKTFLEVGVFDGGLGISFTNERNGNLMQVGPLSVIIASNVDTTGVVMDFGEVEGRKGLIFLGEDNVNHDNGTSSSGSEEGDGGAGVRP